MVGRQVCEAALDAVFSVCLFVGAVPAGAQQENESSGPRKVSVLGRQDARLIRAVSLAVREASLRLESTECRQIFSDFTDGVGARLATNLETLEQSGQTYLRWLIFRNGAEERLCGRGDVALAAEPGSRFVVVCGIRFVGLQRTDPGLAAALVLHEELHVLGLGENPPSPGEITERVVARCGR
jgi:hypothetical protein